MAPLILVQTRNNVLSNDIEEVHKELLEMEELEMNTANAMAVHNSTTNKLDQLEKVQKWRHKSHELTINAKNELNTIRCIRLQMANVNHQLKMSKLSKLGKTKYDEKSEEYKTQTLKEKLAIELDYEKGLNMIWFQLFNIYSHVKAAKYADVYLFDEDYCGDETKLRESFSEDLEKEGLKLTKLRKKCSQQMDQLLNKCQGIIDIEPMNEEILLSQEKYKSVFKREDSNIEEINNQFKEEIEKVNCSLEEARNDNEKLLALLESNKTEALRMVQEKVGEIEQLKLQLQEREQNNTELHQKTEKLDLQLSQLSSQLTELQEKHVQETETLASTHQEVVTQKDAEITKLQSQVKQSRTSVLKLKDQLAAKQASAVTDVLDQEKWKALSAENQELKQKNRKLTKCLNTKGETERKAKEMLGACVNQLNLERSEVVQLKERLESKRIELNRRGREVTQSREEVQSLQDQMEVQRRTNQQNLQMLYQLADHTKALLQKMEKPRQTRETRNKETNVLLENVQHIYKNLLDLRNAVSEAKNACTIEEDANMAMPTKMTKSTTVATPREVTKSTGMPNAQEAQSILEYISKQDPSMFTLTEVQDYPDFLLDEKEMSMTETTENVV